MNEPDQRAPDGAMAGGVAMDHVGAPAPGEPGAADRYDDRHQPRQQHERPQRPCGESDAPASAEVAHSTAHATKKARYHGVVRITGLVSHLIPFSCGAGCTSHPIDDLPQTDAVKNATLSAPVDVVRDAVGHPAHLRRQRRPTWRSPQGYVMAQDRLIQMDLARHKAAGTLSELLGDIAPSVIDADIQMRVHHLRSTVESAWQTLSALDRSRRTRRITKMLTKFAAGVNAYVADLQSQKYTLPPSLVFLYDPQTIKPWTEVDSLLLGQLQAFSLSFDADSDIFRTQLADDGAVDVRRLDGPGAGGAQGHRRRLPDPGAGRSDLHAAVGLDRHAGRHHHGVARRWPTDDPALLPLLQAARLTVRGVGHDNQVNPSVGSNNWVIGPGISATGHVMVANDTHLTLVNPPIFYLAHLVSRGADKPRRDGRAVPRHPRRHPRHERARRLGRRPSTTSTSPTSTRRTSSTATAAARASMFNGQKVALVPRIETFDVGRFGEIIKHHHRHALRRAAPRADHPARHRRPRRRGAGRERAVGQVHRPRAGARAVDA